MNDLVKKLRAWGMAEAKAGVGKQRRELFNEAADEIERLLVENIKAQAEVTPINNARNNVLEEAAKVAWEHDDDVGAVIADAIRALKDKADD